MRAALILSAVVVFSGCDPPAAPPPSAPEPLARPTQGPAVKDDLDRSLEALDAGPPAAAAGAVRSLSGQGAIRLRRAWPRLGPALARALSAERIAFDEALFDLLGKVGPAGQELAGDGLMAPSARARQRTARWLLERGESGLQQVIAALPTMPDADQGVGPIVLQALAARQADPDPGQRAQVARLLVLVARAAPADQAEGDLVQVVPRLLSEALARLSALSADRDQAVRIAALEALGELGPQAVGRLGQVTARLHDPIPGVVEVAGDALHRFGPGALGALRKTLEDPQPRLRVLAARGLGRLGQDWPGEPAAVAARCLAKGLTDPEIPVRRESYQALAGMPVTESTDRLLAAGLADPDPRLRQEVARLLGRRQDNPRAVTALGAALGRNLSEGQEALALALVAALGEHRRDARAAFGPLSRAARRGTDPVRVEALRVILAAGGQREAILRLLGQKLADPSPRVRQLAVTDLGKRLPLGLKVRPRDKRLRRLAARIRRMVDEDPDPDVRLVCRAVELRLPG